MYHEGHISHAVSNSVTLRGWGRDNKDLCHTCTNCTPLRYLNRAEVEAGWGGTYWNESSTGVRFLHQIKNIFDTHTHTHTHTHTTLHTNNSSILYNSNIALSSLSLSVCCEAMEVTIILLGQKVGVVNMQSRAHPQ